MKTNREIRATARAALGGGIFSSAWLGGIGAYFVVTLIIGFTAYFCVGFLLMMPLLCGYMCYFLRLLRTGKSDVGEVFACFRNGNFWRSIGLWLLMSFYLVLWAFIPFAILIKPYSYRMAYYLMLERPDLSVNACITESRRMMHGYKWQLFCMELSFVGWYLLGYLACGVGTLFVVPYQMASYVAFYTTLKDGDSVSEAEREAAVTLAEMRRNNLK